MPNAPTLPPRNTLPRDITVPAMPGLRQTWYDRGPGYWPRRLGLSLMWLVILGLMLLIDAGLYGSIRKSSHTGFTVLIVIDVVVTVALLVFFGVRMAQRWNVPMPPGRRSNLLGGGGKGLTGCLVQLGYLVALVVAVAAFLVCPALYLALFLMSLLPEPLAERQAKLWMADQLRERGIAV